MTALNQARGIERSLVFCWEDWDLYGDMAFQFEGATLTKYGAKAFGVDGSSKDDKYTVAINLDESTAFLYKGDEEISSVTLTLSASKSN